MAMAMAHSTKEEVRQSLPAIKNYVHNKRNELGFCPFCNGHIEDRIESIYAELLTALYKVMRWCEEHGRHEFQTKDIRHLLGQINYTRFGNLVHYGGVVYPIKDESGKRKRGYFGLNIERAREVFANKRPFPMAKKIDMITGECIEETCVLVKDIPALAKFIDADGNYHPEQFTIDGIDTHPSKRGVPALINN